MMPASEHLGAFVRVATLMVPIAVYFFILGLLNSGRHPRLLTGRRDFAILVAALSPLFVLPAVEQLGASLPTVAAVIVAVACGVLLVAPRGATWVIYNLPAHRARRAVCDALEALGLEVQPEQRGFRLPQRGAEVEVGGFSLLRNVSVRLRGGGRPLARRFEASLARVLDDVRVETHPMTVGMLLVSVAMMVAPLALIAHRAADIVRLLTDLLD